ncbi:hypothetical protein Ancab_009070 [Ancistrocladus abbreviatus]
MIMAKDAIAVMDHLGWRKAHVFGHSMGGMIACKLAALVPDRVLSLALLNVTGGGFECFPKLDRMTLSIAVRFLMARTPADRAAVDLDTHYTQIHVSVSWGFLSLLFGKGKQRLMGLCSSIEVRVLPADIMASELSSSMANQQYSSSQASFVQEYLEELVGSSTRRAILYQDYVKGISASGMQSNHGFEGQVNACWTHKMTRAEIESIRSAGFLVSVIHGRHDLIAQIRHARRLAQKLHPFAKMVDLHGGHLVSHEKTNEVNEELLELISASASQISPHDWTNLPDNTPGWIGTWMVIIGTNTVSRYSLSSLYYVIERLNRCLIYFFGLFVLIFDKASSVPVAPLI